MNNDIINKFQYIYNMKISDEDIIKFINLYDKPLVYLNVGIDIISYLTFKEILEYKNISYGKKIVEYSIKLKELDNYYENLYDKNNYSNIYKKYKNKCENDILENYYHFYDFKNAPFIHRKRSKTL
jgi:hypothetical protein